jgi:hypothetical protein
VADDVLRGDELQRRTHRLVDKAVEKWAQTILGDAVMQAPIREGTLRGSGHIEDLSGPGIIAREISFNTPYAARQHEELTWKHPRGGKAKYLEDPLKAHAREGEALVAATIRKGLELGGRL